MDKKKKKRKINIRKLVFWLLSAVCMIMIFIFSGRNSEESTRDSHEVGMVIGQITQEDFEKWTPAEQNSYAESIDHPVRKTAHFIEYTILGFLLFMAWRDDSFKKIINLLVPFVIGALYSFTDELHQRFISGRAGQFADVLLDSSGVMTGIIAASIIGLLFFSFKSGKNSK